MKKPIENAAIAMVGMFLAWVIPGAGHALLGRWVRGLVIFVTIGALFWSGVMVGGVLTVDQQNARWWLAAQLLTGVHGLAGYHRQREVYRELVHEVGELPPDPLELDAILQEKGIALNDNPGDNIARTYTGIAGMLNLLCIMDVLLLGLMGARGEKRGAGGQRGAGVSPALDVPLAKPSEDDGFIPRPDAGKMPAGHEGETPSPRSEGQP
ncbi:MAG: hypothetical protein FWE88_04155 [Phycisphaerae bacterium]|nr:hypothetical protein [Phycisphaerae bacterium]